jgi:hypothetical protein
LEISCGDCMCGLRPPARVGYDFLSDGPAGERSSPLQAYNEILEIPGDDCRGGLRPPARVGYDFLSDGPAGERSSPLQAYNEGWGLAMIVGAVFDRPPGLATLFWGMDRRPDGECWRSLLRPPMLCLSYGGRSQVALTD